MKTEDWKLELSRAVVKQHSGVRWDSYAQKCAPISADCSTLQLQRHKSRSRVWYTQPKSKSGYYPYTLAYDVSRKQCGDPIVKSSLPYNLGTCNSGVHQLSMPMCISPLGWSVDQNLQNELILAMQEKLVEKTQDAKFNLPLFVLEGAKTLDYLSGVVRTVARAYGQARRGKFLRALDIIGIDVKSLSNTTRNAANGWLGWRYGASLLLMDAEGVVKQYADTFILGQKPRFTVKVFGQYDQTKHAPYTLTTPLGECIPPITLSGARYGEVSFRYTLWATFEANSADKKALAEWGLTNPAILAWELIPGSFVLDWVLPIGSYLTHLSAFDGLTLVDAGWGKSHSVDEKLTFTDSWKGNSFTCEPTSNTYSRRQTTMSGLRPDYLRITGVDQWKRWLDTVSFARLAMRR